MSSTVAREIDLADAVTLYLQGLINPSEPDAVTRVYAKVVGLNPDDQATLINGRQVYVIPVTHETPEWITRAETDNVYSIGVAIFQRYTEAGDVPNAFVDAVMLFNEQKIFYPLRNPELSLSGAVVTSAYPDPATPPTVDVWVHQDMLIEQKTVFSRYTFAFKDQTDFTGASS